MFSVSKKWYSDLPVKDKWLILSIAALFFIVVIHTVLNYLSGDFSIVFGRYFGGGVMVLIVGLLFIATGISIIRYVRNLLNIRIGGIELDTTKTIISPIPIIIEQPITNEVPKEIEIVLQVLNDHSNTTGPELNALFKKIAKNHKIKIDLRIFYPYSGEFKKYGVSPMQSCKGKINNIRCMLHYYEHHGWESDST